YPIETLEDADHLRMPDLAFVGELRHRQIAIGRTGAAREEQRLVTGRAIRPDPQELRGPRSPPAIGLVDAGEGEIEGVARPCQLVVRAAEPGRLELGREYQLDDIVAAVAIEVGARAAVQLHDLADDGSFGAAAPLETRH